MSAAGPLLGPSDPDPVEWVNEDSPAPVLLLCEHAGQAVPSALGALGLPPQAFDDDIGWDIGAEALARAIAARLSALLVPQRFCAWRSTPGGARSSTRWTARLATGSHGILDVAPSRSTLSRLA
jgi:hypothetical protein